MDWLWKGDGKGGIKDDIWVFGLRIGVYDGVFFFEMEIIGRVWF